MRTFTIIILLLALPRAGRADSGQPDTIVSRPRGLVARLVDYLSTTNRPDTTRRFDLSLIGGPYYSSENKLGMGLVAAGLYHGHPHDTLTSQVNLYVDVSVTGYYKLGVDGIHYVGAAGHRLVYEASFESMPDRYWGMGYAAGSNDDNETKYKKWHAQLDGALLLRLPVAHLYVGPHVMADYLAARHIANATLWGGQRLHTFTASVGPNTTRATRATMPTGACIPPSTSCLPHAFWATTTPSPLPSSGATAMSACGRVAPWPAACTPASPTATRPGD